MALLAPRQGYHFGPSIPRPPKESPSTPIKTDRSIDPKVFFELFAGTIGIFVLAVLFWKLGRFVRRFNRNKVLRAGNPIDTRYARTWYGWVSRSTHDRNKKAFRDFVACIWDSMAWKSTRDDYSWVWWDPGDIERQKRQRERRRRWWLPNCFRSYEDVPTADEIWNPCGLPRCHGALREDFQAPVNPPTAKIPAPNNVIGSTLREQPLGTDSKPAITRSILEELYRDPLQASDDGSHHHPHFHSPGITSPATHVPVARLQVQSLPSRHIHSFHSRGSIPWFRDGVTRNVSYHVDSVVDHENYQFTTVEPNITITKAKRPDPILPRRLNQSRHRGWSARMQLGPGQASLHHQGDSSGPPGTPMTELLASYSSTESYSSPCLSKQLSSSQRRTLQVSEDRISFASEMFIDNRLHFANEGRIYTKTFRWNSAPARSDPQGKKKMPTPRPTLNDEWLSLCDPKGIRGQCHSSQSRDIGESTAHELSKPPTDQIQLKTGGTSRRLSDWEVMLLERLDRKLGWVFNEFTPGQKPYHFATLANHWLNRETWIVYDPISRVPTNSRREWGDPRFNVPYPEPVLGPKPKYPAITRKRMYNSRIHSWRAMANSHRRRSGIREAIRSITLCENSAEEPPDGHIDPASWALPKPPQGFQMSTAQQNAWYEGGAGWQEKLHDWQQVRRGYRVRKALHEGRVNRGKLKEVVSQVSRTCRPAASKSSPNIDISNIGASTNLVS